MIDPIAVAVLQNRLNAIAEEMGEAMLRTAYSQILNSSRDFSIALIDAQCRLIAQADHIPVHVGAMPWAAKALVEAFPDPAPGEVYLLNDPYCGGSHLPDLTAFVPVFAPGGRLLFWSVVRAHHSDIGGATHGAYNPAATEIWQEGLRIPPIRLTEGGVLREDLLAMLALNVRHPRDFRGDLAAQIGAARLGEQRLLSVIAEAGEAVLSASIEAMLDAAEQHARSIVAGWRDGTYEGDAVLDDDGHGATDIHIRARVTKQGTDVTVDLTGSDPQVTGFVNSSHANMQSAVAMAFAYLLDPDLARNAGAFRPLHVVAKPGTIVWAHDGAPVTMCTSHCSNEIVEAIIVALAQACPERAMGGWGRRLRVAHRRHRPAHRPALHLAHVPGPARRRRLGRRRRLSRRSASGTRSAASSSAASRWPKRASPCCSSTMNSAPAPAATARIAAAMAATLRLRVETAGPARANTAGDGMRHGARGMLGGQDGAPHDYTLLPPETRRRGSCATKEIGVVVPSGSVLHVLSGGGGG